MYNLGLLDDDALARIGEKTKIKNGDIINVTADNFRNERIVCVYSTNNKTFHATTPSTLNELKKLIVLDKNKEKNHSYDWYSDCNVGSKLLWS